jgi:hypothetical protein
MHDIKILKNSFKLAIRKASLIKTLSLGSEQKDSSRNYDVLICDLSSLHDYCL